MWGPANLLQKPFIMPEMGIPATGFLGKSSKKREKQQQQQLTTDDGEAMAKYLRGERDDKINNNIIND